MKWSVMPRDRPDRTQMRRRARARLIFEWPGKVRCEEWTITHSRRYCTAFLLATSLSATDSTVLQVNEDHLSLRRHLRMNEPP